MSERWAEVGRLFERAIELPEPELEAFLAGHCGGDAALAEEVRSLVRHHRLAAGFLEPERAGVEVAIDSAAADEPIGTTIGAWRVTGHLGAGGMGTVYRVERADGQFVQSGALKLIRRGLASEEMIRRFRRERQILATLEHPRIARLLDGGTTPDGLPYLVMELIEGRPLYAWCSEKRLAQKDRLELFLEICAAVSEAHRRLILHRDIKPGNILVASDGTPRLLDFGVAKLFDQEQRDGGDLLTIELPLTPEYSSPEQLRGEPVTTASDVYSLGVLLYELLTGARPFPHRRSVPELIHTILDQDPARPSTAAETTARAGAGDREPGLPDPPAGDPATRRRRLSGDLDTIILKAMSKEPARRYASVDELAADVRRHLSGHAVLARPDTFAYRGAKFVRRNRVAVGAAAALVLALVAGLGASLWQASVARTERALAEQRLRDVHGIANELLFEIHDSLEVVPGTTRVRELVVEKATSYLDRLSHEAIRDTALRFSLADAYERLGQVQGQMWIANVGKAEEAYRSLKQCLAIREALVREYPRSERAWFGLMNVCTRIGNHVFERGKKDEALAMRRRAVEANERLIQLRPDHEPYRVSLPRRRHNLAISMITGGQPQEGLRLMRLGIDEFAELARRKPEDDSHRRGLGVAMFGYASHCSMDRTIPADTAEAWAYRSLAVFEDLSRRLPDDRSARRYPAGIHYLIGEIEAYGQGRPDSGLAHVHINSAVLADMTRQDPGNQDLEATLAISRATEAHLLALVGRADEAEPMLARTTADLRRMARQDTSDTRFASSLVETEIGFGWVEIDRARDGARARWGTGRDWMHRARDSHDAIVAREGVLHYDPEEHAEIAGALALCDSALGGGPVSATR